MRLRVLGPLEARAGGQRVGLGPPRQRAVLGLLAVSPAELVSRETIIDALWGEDPPATAVTMVQGYVSRLRKVLDPGRRPGGPGGPGGPGELVASAGTSYRLRVTASELDLLAFGQLTEHARAAWRDKDAAAAAGLYEQALGLWQGEPLADVEVLRGHPAVAAVARRRAAAVIEYAEAAAASGSRERALPRLEALAAAEPLNERAGALLMFALASAGRQDAALGVFEDLRRRLDQQLGVLPGAGLADAHLQVLRQEDPGPRHPGPARLVATPASVPRQLPTAVPNFTGRAGELAALTGLLEQATAAQRSQQAVVISAIGGTAGVGKTALAVHWAHQAASRFPDGQLYVNLRGYDPAEPMPAADALARFLRALGLPGQDIPAQLDERAARYRSLLAGRKMLVILDNASDVEQVRPLLPGAAGCAAIVTSRDALAGLVARDGAARLDLDLLPLGDAIGLLRALVGARVDADPAAAAGLAARCARLPLALRIAAEFAAARPGVPLAELTRQLAGQQERLDLLDAAGDDRTAIRAVFSWSYHNLDPPTARLFRLLSLHPGAEATVCAAASLAAAPPAKARRLLGELTRAHLLTEHTPGRFGCHDLLRAYATEQATRTRARAGSRAALARLLDYYLHTAAAADQLLYPLRGQVTVAASLPGVTPDQLATRAQALEWLDAEHDGLVSAVLMAAENGYDVHAWQLAYCLETFFYRRGHWHDWAATQHTALAAAVRLGDRHAQAHAHNGIASADTQLGRTASALSHLASSLRLFQEVGNVRGQAWTHLYTSRALEGQQRYREALAHSHQALRLCQAGGSEYHSAQATTLNYVGWQLAMLGRYSQALRYCQRAVALAEQLDDAHAQPAALDSLAYVCRHLGRHTEAAEYYRRAVKVYDELDDRCHKAETLGYAGDAYLADGNLPAAAEAWTQALAILDELNQPGGEAIRARLRELAGR